MHTRRGVDACNKEQVHSVSMNEYPEADGRGIRSMP